MMSKTILDVLTLGDLMVDFTPAGISPKGNLLYERNPGGAPANVAAVSYTHLTVLRDGKYITTQPWSKEYNIPQLIRDMVGREMNEEFPKRNSTIGDVIFEVKNLTRVVNEKKIFDNVSFSVRSGEVLGIAGLVGAGRTEIARAIIGADRATSGEVWLKGEKCSIKAPIDAIRHGITYLPDCLLYTSSHGWQKKPAGKDSTS